eukprot:jgi/Botrbrau1/4874/Bobra.0032s0030.1
MTNSTSDRAVTVDQVEVGSDVTEEGSGVVSRCGRSYARNFNVYVKCFSESMDDADLAGLFKPRGEVAQSRVLRFHDGSSKQVGFVQMATKAGFEKALELHGTEVGGTTLHVTKALSKDERRREVRASREARWPDLRANTSSSHSGNWPDGHAGNPSSTASGPHGTSGAARTGPCVNMGSRGFDRQALRTPSRSLPEGASRRWNRRSGFRMPRRGMLDPASGSLGRMVFGLPGAAHQGMYAQTYPSVYAGSEPASPGAQGTNASFSQSFHPHYFPSQGIYWPPYFAYTSGYPTVRFLRTHALAV